MTYEPMHSVQGQSVGVKEKVTIVATLQEVRINVYLILFPSQVPTF